MKIKPLRWRKPSEPGYEDSICIADGVGGKYSISEDAPKFLLWWPFDEFQFTECATRAEAKTLAENHWQDAVSRLLLQSETV